SACFEPAIDYVVTKIPRFNFDKFEGVSEELTTQMKAVGEVMAIGRTFPESLQKAWQSLENGYAGLGADRDEVIRGEIRDRLKKPYWDRTLQVRNAFKAGASVDEIADVTKMDPWFLYQIQDIVRMEEVIGTHNLERIDERLMRHIKAFGFSDVQIAYLVQDDVNEEQVRAYRKGLGVLPSFNLVDTCAGEFPAQTPYFYSTYESSTEAEVSDREKIVILGSGPNRIGQGIEFDYSCVHGVLAAKEAGYEAIMINCNPETVSTDFDVADKLYFEPVFWERVLDIIELENPKGIIVQLGGQTALKLARRMHEAGIPIIGTSYDDMDMAEHRGRFSTILKELEIPYPPFGMARTVHEAKQTAEEIGYPVLVRPNYVLGGQGMRIAINKEEVETCVNQIWKLMPENPVLLDRFLENALELDVDIVRDGDETWIAGIMQHIEPAGVHSGDSTAVLPPYNLPDEVIKTVEAYVTEIADRLNIIGLMNCQLVIKDNFVYVIEANPRASRTVPFVAKATGIPVANIATHVMLGAKLADFRAKGMLESTLTGFAIKEPVFSWDKFPEVPKELGPEMKSTGEAIAFIDELTDDHFAKPFAIKDLYLSR
ncbi:MAG: carbamoyl-phosphate synthase large subunit, partial [Rhodothermales bacterium]|nr:carbamoyl-phosphate synthase large subunit [Rhodothermales bacterium]